jgi:broad specificity phosphatase PhoE
MTTFLFIRHATNDAVGKRLVGQLAGVHLNKEGKEQAEALAERLQHISISAVYSSPLERAIETAEPLSKSLKQNIIPLNEFNEVDFGEWTNCSFDELSGNEQFHRFNTLRSCTRIPGGEMMTEVQQRMVTGIEQLKEKHKNEIVAVVGHADPIKTVIAHYAGIYIDLMLRLEISPASVSIIQLDDDAAKIIQVNNTGDVRLY